MTLKERYSRACSIFAQIMPDPQTELEYDTPFHLLLAVILSAQCTDKRVNMITPALFQAYPDPQSLAAATFEEVFEYVKSVNYNNTKTRNIIRAAQMLVDKFGGQVPSDIDDLMSLPGVGRKTANVMLAVVWNKPAMAVDTHVFRVSNRMGLTDNSPNPVETEKVLTANLDPELLPKAHHWLILHGRYVCTARRPKCIECALREVCLTYTATNS